MREDGRRLLPQTNEVYNPMPSEAAREMEVELAIAMREARYGLWRAWLALDDCVTPDRQSCTVTPWVVARRF